MTFTLQGSGSELSEPVLPELDDVSALHTLMVLYYETSRALAGLRKLLDPALAQQVSAGRGHGPISGTGIAPRDEAALGKLPASSSLAAEPSGSPDLEAGTFSGLRRF